MSLPRRVGALLVSAVLVLSGCSGGSVAINSGFPPPPAPPAAAGGHAGLSVSGGGGLTLGIILALILADGISWASSRADDPADATGTTRAGEPARRLFQPIDRGWVDRGPGAATVQSPIGRSIPSPRARAVSSTWRPV
jgi:hypothetical protein